MKKAGNGRSNMKLDMLSRDFSKGCFQQGKYVTTPMGKSIN
jgi:hypothetical protein